MIEFNWFLAESNQNEIDPNLSNNKSEINSTTTPTNNNSNDISSKENENVNEREVIIDFMNVIFKSLIS